MIEYKYGVATKIARDIAHNLYINAMHIPITDLNNPHWIVKQ
jgi:hypothetical protein